MPDEQKKPAASSNTEPAKKAAVIDPKKKPKYKRSDRPDDSILTAIEDLQYYIFQITSNSKNFPKRYRYSIITDLHNCVITLYHTVYAALTYKPKHQKDVKIAKKKQQKAYDALTDMKAAINLATRIHDIKFNNLGHLGSLIHEATDCFNKWMRNSSRRYKTLPTKKEYEKQREEQGRKNAEKAAELKRWNEIPREEDGFIHLHFVNEDKSYIPAR